MPYPTGFCYLNVNLDYFNDSLLRESSSNVEANVIKLMVQILIRVRVKLNILEEDLPLMVILLRKISRPILF